MEYLNPPADPPPAARRPAGAREARGPPAPSTNGDGPAAPGAFAGARNRRSARRSSRSAGWRSTTSRSPTATSSRSKTVSLPVRQGEVLALIGPSGCGKTTLLRSLNRLTELTRTATLTGRITLDGTDIARLEPTALRRRVTMVFQQPNPFPMSVFDNIAYVLREQGVAAPAASKTLEPQVHERARSAPGCSRRSRTTSPTRR